MADVVDGEVVVLAPKEGYCVETLPPPEHIERRGLPLALRNHPMLDADPIAGMRVGPSRDIAGSKNSRSTGFKELIDSHPAIDRQPRLFGESDGRAHAHAQDHKIRLHRRGIGQRHTTAVNASDR